MRRGDRLFELIEILRRARGPVAATAIAAELEVCKRTVYRDVAALMAQRVPIRGEAGVGYVLEAGFHMPPLMLTPDEIEAAVLGAQWVQTRGEPDMWRWIPDAMPTEMDSKTARQLIEIASSSPRHEVLACEINRHRARRAPRAAHTLTERSVKAERQQNHLPRGSNPRPQG